SPANLMLRRTLRTRLDLLKPTISDKVARSQFKQQRARPEHECTLSEGTGVYARKYGGSSKWTRGAVVSQTGPVSF
ncbi:hypothetical protein HPB47_018139, partial [Ixodes persulcatus]